MKRRRSTHRFTRRMSATAPWLPVDSRLIPNLFAFGHVQGWARIFLEIEIVTSLLVVLGAILLLVLQIFF